jgi:hypothetical protein
MIKIEGVNLLDKGLAALLGQSVKKVVFEDRF